MGLISRVSSRTYRKKYTCAMNLDLDGMPPVTKHYFGGVLLCSAATKLNYLRPMTLYFNPSRILQGEVWRLATPFFYFGEFSFFYFLSLMMVFRYCKSLEEEHYRGRTAEFLLFFGFSAGSILAISAALSQPWTAPAFKQVMVYLWARRNPHTLLSVFGLVVRAPYLPYVFLVLGFLMDGSIMSDLIGIFVGHVYYFLMDIFPRQEGGFEILSTPEFMKRYFNESYRPVEESRRAPTVSEAPAGDLPGGYDFGGGDLPNLSESEDERNE